MADFPSRGANGGLDCKRDSFFHFVRAWNEHQMRKTPNLHRMMADWLEDSLRDGHQDLLMLVFRDAGKSTLVGLYCSWRLCLEPDLRILVVAAEHHLACLMTRNIRAILERHPMTEHLRPCVKEEWSVDRFTVARRTTLRDPSVLGKGVSGNLTGSRADIVICDDVEVPNTAGTAIKRSELRRRLGELRFITVPGGTRLYIGTPHTHDTIYLDRPGTSSRATGPDNTHKAFLGGFHVLKLPVLDKEDHSIWPERFSLEMLRRMQEETGPARFQSQMMLEPETLEDCRLDPHKLLVYDGEFEVHRSQGIPELRIAGRRMLGACCWWDPSYGKPAVGDSSVVACVFTDEAGHYWLHDIAYLEFDPALVPEVDEASQLCRLVIEFARKNEQYAVTVENNGIGRFLPGILRREADQFGRGWLTVQEHRSSRSKETRILEAFDPVLAAGHLHVHRRVLDTPFLAELSEWTPAGGSADDGLDAVSGCLTMQPLRISRIANPLRKPDWRGAGGGLRVQQEFSVF